MKKYVHTKYIFSVEMPTPMFAQILESKYSYLHLWYPEQELECIRIFSRSNESTHGGISDSEINWKTKVQRIKLCPQCNSEVWMQFFRYIRASLKLISSDIESNAAAALPGST